VSNADASSAWAALLGLAGGLSVAVTVVAAVLVALWLARRKRLPARVPSSSSDFPDDAAADPEDTTTDLGLSAESPLFLQLA
jgi:hypothetical protein